MFENEFWTCLNDIIAVACLSHWSLCEAALNNLDDSKNSLSLDRFYAYVSLTMKSDIRICM